MDQEKILPRIVDEVDLYLMSEDPKSKPHHAYNILTNTLDYLTLALYSAAIILPYTTIMRFYP